MAANRLTIFDVIRRKNKEFLKKEIASGKYDLNVVDDDGHSPIFLAVIDRNEFLINLLIENGAAFNDETRPRDVFCDPLHIAARNCVLHIFQLLVAKGANVNAVDVVGKTPFWYSILLLPLVPFSTNPPILYENCKLIIDCGARFLESEAKMNFASITISHTVPSIKKPTLYSYIPFNHGETNLSYIIFSDTIEVADPLDLQSFCEVFCNLLGAQNVYTEEIFASRGSTLNYAITMRKIDSRYELMKYGKDEEKYNLHFAPYSFQCLKFLLDSNFRLELNCFLDNCAPLNPQQQPKQIRLHVTCYKIVPYRDAKELRENPFDLHVFRCFISWLAMNYKPRYS
ncbi:hypothetical protein B4U79_17475 [Dinothrombium tinctorium]|uniref:Uncharacterized protein n=1 Tax=Dinothrombium tinctorium TaxID=1965070 RepID=A0A3S3PLJ3_9ACAR|nr:hypothetical protein B4U79_17475 [Dinothrombium tinctorium]